MNKSFLGTWPVVTPTVLAHVCLFPGGGGPGLPRRQSKNHSQGVRHHYGLCHQQGQICTTFHVTAHNQNRLLGDTRVHPSRVFICVWSALLPSSRPGELQRDRAGLHARRAGGGRVQPGGCPALHLDWGRL